MITIKSDLAKTVKQVNNKITIKRGLNAADAGTLAKLIQLEVSTQLESLLGPSMDHFEVRLVGNKSVNSVQIVLKDDIAKYIYYGTRAHPVEGHPLASDIGNIHPLEHPVDGVVMIPAIPGKKPEIDQILKNAMIAMKVIR